MNQANRSYRNLDSVSIMHSDSNRRIFSFEEKPKVPALLDELRIPPTLVKELGLREGSELFQGSMGIYVFNRNVLIDCLKNDEDDFGKNIIPSSLQSHKVIAYIFQGYWEDIGTVRAFFEANLALTETVPPYNFFDRLSPIYTRPRFLPASKVNAATIRRAEGGDRYPQHHREWSDNQEFRDHGRRFLRRRSKRILC
jgi:glucose-1-phosphate adenylyltransferase